MLSLIHIFHRFTAYTWSRYRSTFRLRASAICLCDGVHSEWRYFHVWWAFFLSRCQTALSAPV